MKSLIVRTIVIAAGVLASSLQTQAAPKLSLRVSPAVGTAVNPRSCSCYETPPGHRTVARSSVVILPGNPPQRRSGMPLNRAPRRSSVFCRLTKTSIVAGSPATPASST